MGELGRVLRPGGHLLITTHGESCIEGLAEADQQRFPAGKLVAKDEGGGSGTSLCTTCHMERYVRETLAKGFPVADFVPQGLARHQDVYLLRKVQVTST